MWKSDDLYPEVIKRQCILSVVFNTRQFACIRKTTTCCMPPAYGSVYYCIQNIDVEAIS